MGHDADSDPGAGGSSGIAALTRAGVSVVPVPDRGHTIMLDNPRGFVRATAAALAWPEGI
ncbi:hypothetical protein ACWDF9_31210 [Streptomyces rubiginosohelvolus]